MRIVHEFPPLYAEMQAAFPGMRGIKPIFAWGDVIYNPHRIAITPQLEVHESVHAERQLKFRLPEHTDAAIAELETRADFQHWRVEAWWRRYMADPAFRLMEELLAHAAEYRAYIDSPTCNRHIRRAALKAIAQRMASPLYGTGEAFGGLISVHDAMIAIGSPEKPFRTRLPEQGAAAV